MHNVATYLSEMVLLTMYGTLLLSKLEHLFQIRTDNWE